MHRRNAMLLGGMAVALAACSDKSRLPLAPEDVLRSSGSPLTITMFCGNYGGLHPGYCSASASGGSGTGYGFTWTNAYEQYDSGGTSWASPDCWPYGPVTATVTDSSGATASTSAYYDCSSGISY